MAWGAAYFAWLRHTGGKRIGGGIARSYYIAVEGGASADGEAKPLTVVCVVPQHLEEGQDVELDKPELELALGQPVTFPLYTSTVRSDDRPGDVLTVARGPVIGDAALAHGPARRQAERDQARSGDAGGSVHGHRHAGTVLRGQGRRQPLAAGVQHSRSGKAAAGQGRRRGGSGGRRRGADGRVAGGAGAGGRPADPRGLRRTGRAYATGVDQGAGGGAGSAAARVADRAVPTAVGVSGGGRRRAAAVAGSSGALVEPGRLLPAAGLRRPARPLPHRTVVEDDGGAAAAGGGAGAGGRGRLLDPVAARGGRPESNASAIPLRAFTAGAAARKGQGRRQAEPERAGGNVARRGQPWSGWT